MSAGAETLEHELVADLATLGERFVDDQFSDELYRALASTVWTKAGGPEGHVSLSWRRAEQVVNELRGRHGREPLALRQTGGEGDVAAGVGRTLAELGWRAARLDTSRHDEQHLTQPESPPPAEQGERDAPVGDSDEWERLAHEEAEQNRRPTLG